MRCRRPSAAGFTLLEILMVLALMGLVTALLIGSGGMRLAIQDDPEDTALAAIARARNEAVLTGRTLELRHDEKARTLDWGAGHLALGDTNDVRLLAPATQSAVLVAGRALEQELPRVRFYADGTCDPFRLEIVRGESQPSRILAIDPWTCVPLAQGVEAVR